MNANDPAFPMCPPSETGVETGLSKREEFAKAAMQGLLAGYDVKELVAPHSLHVPRADWIARAAVAQADALIAELSKEHP